MQDEGSISETDSTGTTSVSKDEDPSASPFGGRRRRRYYRRRRRYYRRRRRYFKRRGDMLDEDEGVGPRGGLAISSEDEDPDEVAEERQDEGSISETDSTGTTSVSKDEDPSASPFGARRRRYGRRRRRYLRRRRRYLRRRRRYHRRRRGY